MGGGGVPTKTGRTPSAEFSLVEKNWAEPDKKLLSKFDICKKILDPVHMLTKTDTWDYLQCPIIEKNLILFLHWGSS